MVGIQSFWKVHVGEEDNRISYLGLPGMSGVNDEAILSILFALVEFHLHEYLVLFFCGQCNETELRITSKRNMPLVNR